MITSLKKHSINMLAIIVFKIVLSNIYIYISSIYYYAAKFSYNPSPQRTFIGWVVIFIVYFLIELAVDSHSEYYKERTMIRFVFRCLFYLNCIPTCMYFGISDDSIFPFGIFLLFWSLLLLLLFLVPIMPKSREHIFVISDLKIHQVLYWGLIALDIVIILYENFKVNSGLSINLNFSEIYTFRDNYASKTSVLDNLLLFSFGGIINPFLALDKLDKKEYFKFSLYVMVQIIVFGIAGHKSQLIIIPAAIAFKFIISKNLDKYMGFFFAGLSSVCFIILNLLNNAFFVDLCRRVFIVPAVLNYKYITYFSINPKIMMAEDLVFSRILNLFGGRSEYWGLAVANRIGDYWDASYSSYANNGLYAYAYADLGVVGVILYTILVFVLMLKIDSIGSRNGLYVHAMLLVVIATNLLSVPFTSLIYNIFIPLLIVSTLTISLKRG